MIKNFASLFFSLLLTACSGTTTGAAATGELKHTSLSYDKNLWRVILNNVDSIGGSNYGIQFGDQPIVVGFSERPDNTIIMVSSVLLQQVEDGQSKQYQKYEKVNADSSISSLMTPNEWSCSKAIVATASNPGNEMYITNCVYVGSGYWTLLNIVVPVDVTNEEIKAINKVLKDVKHVN